MKDILDSFSEVVSDVGSSGVASYSVYFPMYLLGFSLNIIINNDIAPEDSVQGDQFRTELRRSLQMIESYRDNPTEETHDIVKQIEMTHEMARAFLKKSTKT